MGIQVDNETGGTESQGRDWPPAHAFALKAALYATSFLLITGFTASPRALQAVLGVTTLVLFVRYIRVWRPRLKVTQHSNSLLRTAEVCGGSVVGVVVAHVAVRVVFLSLPESFQLLIATLFTTALGVGVLHCLERAWCSRSTPGGCLMLAFMCLVGLPLVALLCFIMIMELRRHAIL
jgi:hypothetical protein